MKMINNKQITGCGMDEESPVRLCVLGFVPDLQQTARASAE